MQEKLIQLIDRLYSQDLLKEEEVGIFFTDQQNIPTENIQKEKTYQPKNILVTGGAGFIGSHFIRHILATYEACTVINFDKLTYAGNLDNVRDVAAQYPDRYTFIQGDIADANAVDKALTTYDVDTIVNFAAETHVDRSILDADAFIHTDIIGTRVLLEATRTHELSRFIQVSTDEVYGSISEGAFTEESTLAPSSPYAASKAGGDLLVRAYIKTYGVPALLTRCSNNYGPFQHPEKLVPLFVTNLLESKKIPLYGDGLNVRDWLFVGDHCRAIDFILQQGSDGEIYNIGGGQEKTNKEITDRILQTLHKDEAFIEHVTDREGHDRRYAIDYTKLTQLGWKPQYQFADALVKTIHWYVDNEWWWKKVKNTVFESYYKEQYGARHTATV